MTAADSMLRALAACALWAGLVSAGWAEAEVPPAPFLLVAAPAIVDPNFRESVVLVTRHGYAGSLGTVINRPLNVPLSRLTPGDAAFEQIQEGVYFGGPVRMATLTFLFRAKERYRGAVPVAADLFIGADPALLRDVLKRPGAGKDVRIYAGHAGWGPGQLEMEIERGGWFLTEANLAYVFHAKPEAIWSELVKRASMRSVEIAPALLSLPAH